MMKYRVILKVGYNEAWFEFNEIQDAGEFAKSILMYHVDCEDTKRKSSVRIDMIDTTIESEEDED